MKFLNEVATTGRGKSRAYLKTGNCFPDFAKSGLAELPQTLILQNNKFGVSVENQSSGASAPPICSGNHAARNIPFGCAFHDDRPCFEHRIIKRSRDLPGQELFQYIDDDGEQRTVGSADVNDYLRTITGEDYTAKDFRTWSGSMLAAIALQEYEKFDSEAQAKKNIVRAIESVAEKLGNTPTICRKCYVHPGVIEAYLDGITLGALRERAQEELENDVHALKPEEAAVLGLLQQRLRMAAPEKKKRQRTATRKTS
jgi:DNA topoisomerase IB